MCFEKVLLLVVCCILRQVRAISRAHSKLKIGQRAMALLLSRAVLNSKCWLCPAAVNCSSNVFRFHCKDQGQLSFLCKVLTMRMRVQKRKISCCKLSKIICLYSVSAEWGLPEMLMMEK